MTDTSLILKRFSVAAVAVATLGAGLPALLSTSPASADHAPGHEATTPPGQATPSDTPTATISPSTSPSPTISFTPSPRASASASASTSASPAATKAPNPQGPPSAKPTTSPQGPPATPPGCARAAEVLLERSTITATGTTGVAVQAAPNTFVELFAYTRPSTRYVLVRSGTTDNTGTVTFTPLRPPANTRLQARQRGCAFGESRVLNVRTQLSLNVVRNGPRDYTFSGRAIPARPNGLIVTLYRVTPDGREVLTAQTRANANVGQEGYDPTRPAGSYSIRRVFLGSGRFGFVVRTGQDLQNAPGRSNTRPTLIF